MQGRRRDIRYFLSHSGPRVPAVYLTWVHWMFLAFFPFNGINNLRVFNVAFGSIPTAPTSFLFQFTGLAKSAKQQEAAIKASSVGR